MSSLLFEGKGMAPVSMIDACLDMARQSSAALSFAFAEPADGLLALLCVNRWSGMSLRVKGIRLEVMHSSEAQRPGSPVVHLSTTVASR